MGDDEWNTVAHDVIDAIRSLGNIHRLEILLALDRVEQEHQKPRYSLSFSELYDQVDIDSTSQFSYHLNQLVGQFISETPAGYRLSYSGNKIVRVILSGSYESAATFEETEVSGSCIFCESATLVALVEEELFRIRCGTCDAILVTDFIPQSQSRGRTVEGIIDSYGYRLWSMALQLRGGVCPECFGQVEKHVDTYEQNDNSLYIHVNRCRECQYIITLPVEIAVALHPAVLYALTNHDLPVLDIPLWEFFEYVTTGVLSTNIITEDPFKARCDVTLPNQTLTLAIEDVDQVSLIS